MHALQQTASDVAAMNAEASSISEQQLDGLFLKLLLMVYHY